MNTKKDYKQSDLKLAYDFVCDVIGRDIGSKCRVPYVVDGRTLFYMIALQTTNASYVNIAKMVNRDHSTVAHSVKSCFHLIRQDKKLMSFYNVYIENHINEKAIDNTPIEDLKKYNDLLKEHNTLLDLYNRQALKDQSSTFLTDNEKMYRKLSKEERSLYDSKASIVLKSFEWKRKDSKRKEVFEIINCNN